MGPCFIPNHSLHVNCCVFHSFTVTVYVLLCGELQEVVLGLFIGNFPNKLQEVHRILEMSKYLLCFFKNFTQF